MRLASIVFGTALFLEACAAPMSDDAPGDGTWKVQHMEDAGALISVWGSGPDDVWAAGGQVGRGLVLHKDGESWLPVDTGADQLLWWIYGFRADDIYAVGEGGLILHYDGASWRRAESGTDKTLFGVWGASGDDVWIVGGDPTGPAGSAVVLRGQGESFQLVEDLPAELSPSSLFKIYGYSSRDVIAVGSGGTVLRFDGETWSRDPVPTTEPLFSLWGRARDDLYAVGGYGAGEVLHFDGTEWRETPDEGFGHGLSGVFTAPDYPTIAVGADLYVVEIDPNGTEVEPQLPTMAPVPSLHGVWGDGVGTTYAVGGDLLDYPDLESGVILQRR